jgi:hypothetical protein
VKQLLSFRDHPADGCARVNELIDRHIEDVASRIAALQALKKQLRGLRKSCTEGREAADCPILQQLNTSGNPLGDEASSHAECSNKCQAVN